MGKRSFFYIVNMLTSTKKLSSSLNLIKKIYTIIQSNPSICIIFKVIYVKVKYIYLLMWQLDDSVKK